MPAEEVGAAGEAGRVARAVGGVPDVVGGVDGLVGGRILLDGARGEGLLGLGVAADGGDLPVDGEAVLEGDGGVVQGEDDGEIGLILVGAVAGEGNVESDIPVGHGAAPGGASRQEDQRW